MKKMGLKLAGMALLMAFCILMPHEKALAAPDDTIPQGVSAAGMDLSGMTREEATAAISSYVSALGEKEVQLMSEDGKSVSVTAGALGLSWKNQGIVEEAVNLGRKGNIVARYKAKEDLEHKGRDYEIELEFDRNAISGVVEGQCSQFNQEAVDAHLTRVNGSFEVEEGQTGYIVDEAASVSAIYDYMTQEWNRQDGSIQLAMTVDEPQGKAEDLLKVTDVLGTFTTSYSSSGPSRSKNVSNGCALIDGTTLYPGETFSTYDAVKPFSEENGYYMAGSYLNGKVVDSIGGGICQVSTTLYNAVLLAELQVDERHNHSMIVNYVDPSMDAAIAESSGKDFVFTNNTEYPIYIEGYTSNKKITFTIYGVETRDSNRKVTYESEVLETISPGAEVINQDSSQPVGYVDVQSAHTGYKARLWKVVTVDGEEVSREQVNSSSYKMTPRTATVGTSTSDANVYNELQAAIATGSIDHVKSVASALANGQSTTTQPSTGVDPALAAILEGKTPEEQAILIQQYNEQLAQQQQQAGQ